LYIVKRILSVYFIADGSVTIDTSSFSWRFADTEAKEQQQIEATEQQQTERHSSGASNFILKDINLCLQKVC